jgi:drug/metabolite transporter (DMT)-like permease
VAVYGLLGVAAIWGATYVVKDAVASMPVSDFLTWRFATGTAVVVAVRPRAVFRLGSRDVRAGIMLGLALAAAYLLQTLGLRSTPASVSGFITGLLVVLTPLGAALLYRQLPSGSCWTAVGLATAGLALLSLRGLSSGRARCSRWVRCCVRCTHPRVEPLGGRPQPTRPGRPSAHDGHGDRRGHHDA